MWRFLKTLYIRTCGYSYTNLGRLFLRLFIGIMLMQFGIRQLYDFSSSVSLFPSVFGMSAEASMIIMIVIEIFCSLMIMVGFCTRLMSIPPLMAMIVAEWYILAVKTDIMPYMLSWADPGYVPFLFMGIYFFIILVGPGKISVDYFLSLYLLHSDNRSENVLEEV